MIYETWSFVVLGKVSKLDRKSILEMEPKILILESFESCAVWVI